MHEKKHFNPCPRASHDLNPKSKIMDFRLDFAVIVISHLTLLSGGSHEASNYKGPKVTAREAGEFI
jgi:hypothetical protein